MRGREGIGKNDHSGMVEVCEGLGDDFRRANARGTDFLGDGNCMETLVGLDKR